MVVNNRLKTEAAVVLLLSGGSAYAISSVLSDSKSIYSEDIEEEVVGEDAEDSIDARTGKPRKQIEQKLRNYKFSLIKDTTENQESKWEEHAAKISKKMGAITKEEIKKFCKEKYEKLYIKHKNWSELKGAIKKCTEPPSFKERAGQLNIKLIEDETNATDLWTARFKKLGSERLQKIADYTTVLITGWHGNIGLSHIDLKNFCTTVGNINWTQVSVEKSTKQEFSNYLEGCAKQEDSDFSYWKGKPYKKISN